MKKYIATEQVVESVECAELEMFTKGREMKTGESRKGTLKKRGKFDYRFDEEGTREPRKHPWDCHATLVQRSWGRISANAHGVTVHMYVPARDFVFPEVLAEIIDEYNDNMLAELVTKDVRGVMEQLKSLKPV